MVIFMGVEDFQSEELRGFGEGEQFAGPFFMVGEIGGVIGVCGLDDVVGEVERVGRVAGAHELFRVACRLP